MSIAEFVSCYSGYAESRGYPQLAQLLDDARHQAGDFDLADCHMKKYGPSHFCCLLLVGCWLLLVGCCLLVVGCWLLVVVFSTLRLFVVLFKLPLSPRNSLGYQDIGRMTARGFTEVADSHSLKITVP